MTEFLSREDRETLLKMREDYVDVFHRQPELREENEQTWMSIVDQYEKINSVLDQDAAEKLNLVCTRKLDENNNL